MTKGRLEAFSDGVIAIIITIMVLELKVPHGDTIGQMAASVAPVMLSYALSFVFVGIYWNNHHHLLHAATTVNGKILWANLHLLFWLSLVPWATKWTAESFDDDGHRSLALAVYGTIFFLAGFAYQFLQRFIIDQQGASSKLGAAIGNDVKGKASAALYLASIGLAFVSAWLAIACFIIVAVLWFVPDQRIEKKLEHEK